MADRPYPGSVWTEELQEAPDELAALLLPLVDQVHALLLHTVYQLLGPLLHRAHRLLHLVHLVLQAVLLILRRGDVERELARASALESALEGKCALGMDARCVLCL